MPQDEKSRSTTETELETNGAVPERVFYLLHTLIVSWKISLSKKYSFLINVYISPPLIDAIHHLGHVLNTSLFI